MRPYQYHRLMADRTGRAQKPSDLGVLNSTALYPAKHTDRSCV